MLKGRKIIFQNAIYVGDMGITIITLHIAFYARFGLTGILPSLPGTEYMIFCVSYLVLWAYLSRRRLTFNSRKIQPLRHEAWDVLRLTSICIFVSMIPAFFIRDYPMSRLFIVYLWCIQTLTLSIFRISVRLLLRYIRKRGFNHRQILIVGKNSRAEKLLKTIHKAPEYGLTVVGYVDVENGYHTEYLKNHPLLGNINGLEAILRTNIIDLIFITLPLKSFYSEIEKIISICEKVGVEVEIPTEFFEVKSSKYHISTFDGIQTINFYTSPQKNVGRIIVKRFIDLTLSVPVLILLLPLFLIVALSIKLTSEGPVFFTQNRVGYNGRLFKLLKFRTMVKDAELMKKRLMDMNELDGPVFKIKNDPRITTVGAFLRKTSIDELPQLLNVLKGNMSLVGPRPPLPDEVDQYRLGDRRRLSVYPGITGLWQVSGRNKVSFEKWMELDRKYIDQWSLWLDFKILLKTIPVVISTKNGY